MDLEMLIVKIYRLRSSQGRMYDKKQHISVKYDSRGEAMKYARIIFIILVCVLAACQLFAIQQFMALPDAQVEEIMLKKIDGATREGKFLRLETDKGTVVFEDRINVGEGSAKYYLMSLRNNRGTFYLVRMFGYEGKGYILVDKTTGQSIDLYRIPKFSPDGKKFVDVSLDLEAGYAPNLIRIHKKVGKEFSKDWELIFQGMKGPANPVWLNDSAVVFFEVTFDDVPIAANLKKKPFIIEWKNDRWDAPRPLK
jgi:hypothetical protein